MNCYCDIISIVCTHGSPILRGSGTLPRPAVGGTLVQHRGSWSISLAECNNPDPLDQDQVSINTSDPTACLQYRSRVCAPAVSVRSSRRDVPLRVQGSVVLR